MGIPFNWHPILMTLSLIFLYGNGEFRYDCTLPSNNQPCPGALIYRVIPPRNDAHKLKLKLAHAGIMIVAFAPIVALLLGLSAITVPWSTLVLSVALYIVIPVIISQVIRKSLIRNGSTARLDALLAKIQPASLVALLATLVLLFAFQGE